MFTSLYGGNAGLSTPLTRNANSGLVPAGRRRGRFSCPRRTACTPRRSTRIPPTRSWFASGRVDSLNAFAPDIEIARVQNWTVGFARSISKDTAVEIRYVGNKGSSQWSALNYNSIRTENLLANGFFNEFKLAMANLTANNAAGGSRTGSFAYYGAGTGTSPLPIYLGLPQRQDGLHEPGGLHGRDEHVVANTTLAGPAGRRRTQPRRRRLATSTARRRAGPTRRTPGIRRTSSC